MTVTQDAAPDVVGDDAGAPGQLTLTLFGLHARSRGGWLSVAALIRLLADLGVEEPAVRSALSRLKRRGLLEAERRDGAAGYALSSSAVELLVEGDARIFGRRRAGRDDGWLLAVFSVPESQRDRRHQLRTSLTQLGFGTVAPGVWVAPGHLVEQTRVALARRGLTEFVDLFRASTVDALPGAGADLAAKVATWWDLDPVAESCATFSERFSALDDDDALRALSLDPQAAYRAYLPMLTAWRRLPYLDPGLPLDLLPADWPGLRAEQLFVAADQALRGPAGRHADALIAAPAPPSPRSPRAPRAATAR
ncbi:PaaX family transcriptional regulator C-terminal domain-containing protein [Quadrisphaera granulorum]